MPNKPETSHILGVDFGRAKIGLAIADSETKIATRLKTLENNKLLFDDLATIIRENCIKTVIIGNPMLERQGSMGNQDIYKRFGDALKIIVPEIEIKYANEMFTTKMAQANLIEKGVKGVKFHDHEEAARIILQSWLDNKQ